MKALYLLIALFIPFSFNFSFADTVTTCNQLDGIMVNLLVCPNSNKIREGKFCMLSYKPVVYFNGCTKGIGEYGTTFYKPCLKHDFCYHHEPATNGLTKKECDQGFYDDMLTVCLSKESTKDFLSCSSVAWAFYQGVKVGGKKSWKCSNSKFDYSDLDDVFKNLK